jgi:hypothetical protein
MATKTPTKTKRRQDTKTRSWQNLTERRKLRHIENTLDKAIVQALEDGSIQSHEDFKDYVENYSLESGKAPITVELCVGNEGDDDIKGYRFYLTSNPSYKTSGKYLIKNLEGITDKDENYFTPSNIEEVFGFGEAELDDFDEELDDESFDLDEELDKDIDINFDDLDDGLDEAQPSVSQVKTKAATKTSAKSQNKSQGKTQAKSEQKPETSNGAVQNSRYREPLEETSRLSASAATNGRETNGINITGLAGQLATLGIVVSQELLEHLAEQDDEKRLKQVLKELQRQNERVDNLASRLQETTVNSSDSSTKFEEPETDNPLAAAASKISTKVDNLGLQLDQNYKSEPLKLDKNASISEQLDQIEAYLKVLSKRLDRLELAVSRLEKQMALQQQSSSNSSEIDEFEDKVIQPPSGSPPTKEVDVLEQLTKRKIYQQQAACADALVGFASVKGKLFNESAEEGIAISNNKTLQFENHGSQIEMVLSNSQGATLFSGTRTDGKWEITEDHLSPEEKIGICKLPQSKQEYAIKSSAQAVIDKFKQQLPDRFNGEEEPNFTWTEKGKVKYEFEVVTLPNKTQLLQGFDPNRNDQQVFDAVLIAGEPPEILQCNIPLRDMETLINNQPTKTSTQTEQTSKSRSQKATSKVPKEEMEV